MNSPQQRTLLMSGVALVAGACLVVAVLSSNSNGADAPVTTNAVSSTTDSVTTTTDAISTTSLDPSTSSLVPTTDLIDLNGQEPTTDKPCTMDVRSLASGDSGDAVVCLQEALISAGFLSSSATGTYDNATVSAVKKLQIERDLFVDGKAGRETALSLGILPDETSLVVHTPPPTPGAVDSLGYKLSSVASTGGNTPLLPPNSGTGRRLVYDRAGQRIWAVGDDNIVIRSWLISGSKYNNETPGTHAVYSRSDVSTAWNGKAYLYKMVRWLKTDIGAIGFHALPIRVADNTPYQTDTELGTRLSGGCQRQANLDADFTWDFAQIGTPVIVL